jgi:PAS domain S-box-containing protein
MDYTGRSREEAKGQGWLKTIHPDEQEQVKASLRRGIQDGTSVRAEHRIRAADGSYRWFLINSLPARDDSGKILHWVGAATDIHEEQQARASLEGAKQIAESANLAKDRFLAAVSHELRTPLAAILLWTKLLQESKPAEDAETHQGLTAIRSSAEAQKNLIEDLLDSSRIAEGKMRLDLKPTDLPSTVRSAVDAILPAAHAKGVTVVSDIGDVGTVMADPHRLQQVVWNLLTNGVKFTPPGGTITLVLSRQEDDVEIRVTDTGVGIDPAFLPRIFDRFQQGAGTPSQAASGLGLGLAISRQLVELHQGSITATSRGPDLGSTFTVSLPLPLIDEGGESAAP